MLPLTDKQDLSPDTSENDRAAIAEMKETRALALAGAVDAVAARAIALRVDLQNAMREIARLRSVLRERDARIVELEKPRGKRKPSG
jgi:hypothetical protein